MQIHHQNKLGMSSAVQSNQQGVNQGPPAQGQSQPSANGQPGGTHVVVFGSQDAYGNQVRINTISQFVSPTLFLLLLLLLRRILLLVCNFKFS